MADPATNKKRRAERLLEWYDQNARQLRWRVGPADRAAGVRPDPYRVWLSEIMLQQTTVATVTPRFAEFLERWPSVADLAAAPLDDVLAAWAGLGYYARARNLHRCAVAVVEQFDGAFPSDVDDLLSLPGVGDYTASAIAAIAFDVWAVPVDGNIERVTARLDLIDETGPALKSAVKKQASAFWPAERSGDFAQAMMDLGAGLCTPRKPSCLLCPIAEGCEARGAGVQETLPRKAKKRPKPTRYGRAFMLVNSKGEVLFERRPEKGLLGGMLGLPGDVWSEAPPEDDAAAPEPREWAEQGIVRHTFTHFHLELTVMTAKTRRRAKPEEVWLDPQATKLPTVMRKAVDLGLTQAPPQQQRAAG